MEMYEILFNNGHTELVDRDTVDTMIDELELFERDDVSQIHLLKVDGDFETVWTVEEGLLMRDY